MNTLYNKDDSDDLYIIKRDYNKNIFNEKILTTENNESKYLNNKTDLIHNNNISKIINGSNENNNINTEANNNFIHHKTKSMEKDYISINSNINKEKDK